MGALFTVSFISYWRARGLKEEVIALRLGLTPEAYARIIGNMNPGPAVDAAQTAGIVPVGAAGPGARRET